jgi:hypothetical protein
VVTSARELICVAWCSLLTCHRSPRRHPPPAALSMFAF